MSADLRSRIPNISDLARQLDSDYSHLHAVLKGAQPAGAKLAVRIEATTAGAILRSDLRPDLWAPAAQEAAQV